MLISDLFSQQKKHKIKNNLYSVFLFIGKNIKYFRLRE
jgi:hypothetical protein